MPAHIASMPATTPTSTTTATATSTARTPAAPARPGSPEASAALIRRTFATNPAYAAAITACRTTAQLSLLLDVSLEVKSFSWCLLHFNVSTASPARPCPSLTFYSSDYFTVSEPHTAFKMLRRIALSHPSLFPNLAL